MLWILGDGFVYGEGRFGEMFSQAIEDYSQESARNAMWVASRIEPVRRLTALSWSHHQQVASLEPREQDRLLALAAERKLSVTELRAAVRLFREPEPPKPDWQEPADPPEVVTYVSEGEEGNGAPTEQPSREELSQDRENSLLADFQHLLQLCKALLTAERGDLVRGLKPNEEEAVRLRTALGFFIAEHDRKGEWG
jgi:hypothetical protein